MKNLFLGLVMLAGTASFATTNKSGELKTTQINSIISETTSEIVTSSNEDALPWYMVTTVTTHNYFLFGYWVGSSVDTNTKIVYLP